MKNISVIGAGTMGNGIAQVFASHQFDVTLIDISTEALQRGLANIEKSLDRLITKGTLTTEQKNETLKRLATNTSIEDGVKQADLVVEAATENIDLKLDIFKKIDLASPPHCLLATNTSSISITKIAAATNRPQNVIGMHFMNPVPIMKLVEVISGYSTSKETLQKTIDLSVALNKIPVEVNDYPGFIANRILMPMINEAIYSLYEGVAGVTQIDQIMKLGMAHPMGPLQLADFIGLDVCLAILKVLHEGFGNPKYAPCPLLVNMVAAKKLGAKTNEGFYLYTSGSKDLVVSPQFTS